MRADFFVIGAQKAGSTSLVEALRSHPQIYMPAAETPCFEDPNYQQGGLERLESQLQQGDSFAQVGAKRALWLGRPECPARIAAHFPDARLIAILRNPIERAVSSLYNLMHATKLPLREPDDAINTILDQSMQLEYPIADMVLNFGLYGQHIRRYLEYFSRDQLLLVLFDDLRSNTQELNRTMYAFLDVDTNHCFESAGRRPMAVPYSIPRLRILRTLSPMHLQLSDDGMRRAPRRGPVPAMFRSLTRILDRAVLEPLFPSTRPTLQPATLDRLVAFYKNDVEALAPLLDRDLSHWLRRES